jgi:YopT peptidase
MPNWFYQIAHAITASRGDSVRDSVAQCGGHCTWAFSQCEPPVVTQILQTADTQIGVCEALAAHWILYHANDRALPDLLFPGGQLDLARLFKVMTMHTGGIRATSQDAFTTSWLKERGILERKGSACYNPSRKFGDQFVEYRGSAPSASTEGATGWFSVNAFLDDLLKNTTRARDGGRTAGAYYKISFQGMLGAHAMAAWVAEDLVFLDPNFGEFWFAKPTNFAQWFGYEFWTRSLYFAGLSGQYWLIPYAKAMPFALRA